MHCKGYIITKDLPTNEKLTEILEKYRETEETKKFEWDWYQIGGVYGGEIKINFNPEENEDEYFMFKDRNNKYFISQILNKLKENSDSYYDELDYLIYMGLRENILYVDGAYYNDIINFDITNCYVVIDEEENLYVREYWNGNDWITDEKFDEKVSKINLKDKFITTIDFHY